MERVSRELHILKLVRHSSIAQLYEIVESPERIFIVMEYAQNGEFFDYIMDGRVYLPPYPAGMKERHITTSHRLSRDWITCTGFASRTGTSNPRTCSWMSITD